MIHSTRGRKHPRQDASKRNKKTVKKYDPQQPQARDEGPRLIPLGTSKAEHPFQHYLDLADVALSNKKRTS
jgi:hypothetical protein